MMADPVTMAVVGGSIGAMMNEDDPLMGALMGAAGGYGGGVLLGGAGAGAAGSSGILPGAASGSITAGANIPAGAAFINPAGVNAMTAATTGPSGALGVEAAKAAGAGIFSGGMPATNAAMQGQGLAQTTAMQRPLSLGMTGVEPGQGYEYTIGDRLGQVGQFAQQNPVLTQMGLQTAQQMMREQPTQMAPAGQVSRGQIQGGDFMSLLNPQQGQVIRPQPISLLG